MEALTMPYGEEKFWRVLGCSSMSTSVLTLAKRAGGEIGRRVLMQGRGYYLKFCLLWIAESMKGGPHLYGGGERTLSEYLINVKSVGGCGILIDDSIFISVSKMY